MPIGIKTQFSQFLQQLAVSLDIPESRYKEAEERYQAVAKWLGSEGSPLAHLKPEIYPQGSFRLGTVIKPISDEDEYDIDLVCELALSKDHLTQKQLKQLVGDRLKANDTYVRLLDSKEGRRCWTLNYKNQAKFHMDILPAITADELLIKQIQEKRVSKGWAALAIFITDTTNADYEKLNTDWPRSNPKGYAEWFKECIKIQFEELRKICAESMRASIEDVPDYKIKTPLQQVIQILKRHRDIVFINDQKDKPISIIITTLAAKAYNNEADLLESITNVISRMHEFISTSEGTCWIPNPVDSSENFADKWQEHPQREIKFRRWLNQIQDDFDSALRKGDIRSFGAALQQRFGERVINEAVYKSERILNAKIAAANIIYPRVEIKNPPKPWGLYGK